MKGLYLFLSVALALPLSAQYSDDFSDGDFTNNPTWLGDAAQFQISVANALWLNDGAAQSSNVRYLATASNAMDNASWEALVRLEFNPSSSNFARFYLVSDVAALSGNLNGYFILVGGSDDEIGLYRQTGSTTTPLILSPPASVDQDPVNVRVRATRDNSGNWELLWDATGGSNFVSLGTATDNSHTFSAFSGVYCRYTTTRADKMFFDDFVVTGTGQSDQTPPTVSSVAAESTTQVRVSFSEPVSPATASTTSNYLISSGIGNPSAAQPNPQAANEVVLTLANPISTSTLYNLDITAVQDFSGNTMQDTSLPIALVVATSGDIVINEIHPDPTPAIGMPEYEYIELYNRTNLPINIDQFVLRVGSSDRVLPAATIQPDSFLVLTDIDAQGLFLPNTPIAYLSSWPSLTNSGATIEFEDSTGSLLDRVTYDLDFYNDASKDDGGYSMERINPNEFCGGSGNWAASLNNSGGTPGRSNSVFDPTPVAPALTLVEAETASQVLLEFNKELDAGSISPANFNISGGIGAPLSVALVAPNQLRLLLGVALQVNTTYSLSFVNDINDCAGNSFGAGIQEDLLFYAPEAFDVLINEFMADEAPAVLLPEAEYIELYNTKDFPINLRDWTIEVGSSSYTLPSGVIPPDSFVVLVDEDEAALFSGINVVSMPSLGSLTNTSGTIALRAPNGSLLHSVLYSDSWYGSNAKSDGGWSLEMIDPSNPCGGRNNWTASTSTQGGTPGATNSVLGTSVDASLPRMYRSGFLAPDTAYLYFSEQLSPGSLDLSDITLSAAPGLPIDVRLIQPELQVARILLANPINPGEEVWVTISGNVEDCAGNLMPQDSVRLRNPEAILEQDILINEVLSDPKDDGIDYLEIYHNGTEAVDLSQLYLTTLDTLTGEFETTYRAAPLPLLLFPGEYLLLSEDQEIVKSQYLTEDSLAFWDVEDLPSLNNDDDAITLVNISLQVIDHLSYNADEFQFPLLETTDGVAMERILFSNPTQDPTNWNSAAQAKGFGTPGYRNSQSGILEPITEDIVLDPDIFSPNSDGYKDQMFIRYQLSEPGALGTVTIYDAAGRLVRTLANNVLLESSGQFIWDGIDDEGNKARTGIHIVAFEIFSPDGRTELYKKPCTVAAQF